MILCLGSNLGDRLQNLKDARKKLNEIFTFQDATGIYETDPVDFEDWPKFYNQLLQYECPKDNPDHILSIIKDLEKKLGREESKDKQPRVIDIDILFINDLQYRSNKLTLPHPETFNRAFVLTLLPKLDLYPTLQEWFELEPGELDLKLIY